MIIQYDELFLVLCKRNFSGKTQFCDVLGFEINDDLYPTGHEVCLISYIYDKWLS